MKTRNPIDVRESESRKTVLPCARALAGAKRRRAAVGSALAFGILCFWIGGKTEAAPDPVSKPEDRIGVEDFELIGGWRIPQPFARGGLAIDFESGRVFAGGHAQQNNFQEFKLVDMGKGEDVNRWPILEHVATHKKFWGRGYPGGLEFRDGVLWVSPRVFYDTKPSDLTLYGKNLETGEITTKETGLSQPAFGGGFVKGRDDWLIGCGGYESGGGSVSGPTLATPDGKILMKKAKHGTMVWEDRELRPPNYTVEQDSWVGLAPRDGIGRWASDRVYAGGIWHPRGLMYWAMLGVGELKYSRQNKTFGASNETWLYTYDPYTYDDVEFSEWPYGFVYGHAVDATGRLYLLVQNAWQSADYKTDPAIKVFRIKE